MSIGNDCLPVVTSLLHGWICHWLCVVYSVMCNVCAELMQIRCDEDETDCMTLIKLHQSTSRSCVFLSQLVHRRHLRSAACGDLQVLACRTSTFGPRSFTACAPKLWNSLLLSLRDSALTLTSLCSRLKTHLFSMSYGRTRDCVGCKNSRIINFLIHTYIVVILRSVVNVAACEAPGSRASENL